VLALQQRAGGGQAEAEAVADGGIDVLGRGHAGLQQVQRLADQRMLHAVAEKAGNIALDLHRALAQGPHPLTHLVGQCRVGGLGADHLDQRHQIGGHEEVQAHHARLGLQTLTDLADREA
jgi:hypothetical protein